MKIRVEEYICLDGSNPYKAWFDNFDPQAAAKIVTAKLRLALGNTSSVKWFDGIGEYVINWGPGTVFTLPRMVTPSSSCSAVVLSAGSRKISIGQRLCTMNTRRERKPSLPPTKLKK